MRAPTGVDMQMLNGFMPGAPLLRQSMAPSLSITPALCALEFHGARLLPASATSLILSR